MASGVLGSRNHHRYRPARDGLIMGLPAAATHRLQVLRAIEEGWQAFCRAPWTFLLFQLLVLVVALPFAGLAITGAVRLAGEELPALHPIAAGLALVIGALGYVVATLWGLVGLTRAAWRSLEGQRPDLRSFSRWDGAAGGRLLLSSLALVLVVGLTGLIAALLSTGLGRIHAVLASLPLLLFAAAYVWFLITQKFLIQLSLFGERNPVATLQAGIAGVNPSWWLVLWLAVVETAMHAIALLFSYGGLFVIIPVMLCISTAAYRQLFGAEDRTGLLRED
jgi:hypothetical protein